MDRIGDRAFPRNGWYQEQGTALEACQGAPDTIKPGAVVKMAEALELAREGLDGVIHGDDPLSLRGDRFDKITEALRAYYGEPE